MSNKDGTCVEFGENACTHLVLEESYSFDLTPEAVKATFVVKQEVSSKFIEISKRSQM